MPFPPFPGAAGPSQPPLPAPVRGAAPAGLSALGGCGLRVPQDLQGV